MAEQKRTIKTSPKPRPKSVRLDRPDREKILHEICLCCVHKPLEIHEGMWRDSPKTLIGSGCYKKLEGNNYCDLALKAIKAILALIPDEKLLIESLREIITSLEAKVEKAKKQGRTDVVRWIKFHPGKDKHTFDEWFEWRDRLKGWDIDFEALQDTDKKEEKE